MLRIVFGSEDLVRVRVASLPDPLWESVLSVHQLSTPSRDAGPYAHWAGWARTVARAQVLPPARVLHELAAPRRYFPDFLTPTVGRDGLDAGIDSLMHTPAPRIAAELAKAAAGSRLPGWTTDLAAGQPARLHWLGRALASYYRGAIEPFLDRITTHVDTHRTNAMSTLATDGPVALLRSLDVTLRWEPPVLTTRYPVDLTLDLNGRGLTLVPSFFCRNTPVTLADPTLDPVLVYPTDPPVNWIQPRQPAAGDDKHLAALIGEPRARLIRALTSPAGTGELADRTGMPTSSTSEHAAVLRNAGLIRSDRRGRRMVHSLTALGRSLRAGDLRG